MAPALERVDSNPYARYVFQITGHAPRFWGMETSFSSLQVTRFGSGVLMRHGSHLVSLA